MTTFEILGILYLSVTVLSLFVTAVDINIKGIDNLWDWLWYSILWPKWCILSLWKILKL